MNDNLIFLTYSLLEDQNSIRGNETELSLRHYIQAGFGLPTQGSRFSWVHRSDRVSRVKGKGHPITGHEGPEREYRFSSTLSLTWAVHGGVWLTPRPGRCTRGNDAVPIVQEAGWATGSVWTSAENLAPTEFDPETVQLVASHSTDYAIPSHCRTETVSIHLLLMSRLRMSGA